MSEASTQQLIQCFQAVFPNLSASEITGASTDTVADWDSVAQVTLISVVEESFGVMLAEERYGELTSFSAWREHLETLRG